jgi:hypothetical protein
MVKPLELTPEWVLSELTDSLYADGCGNISVGTSTANDAKWIKLALNTLSIPYQENEFGEGDVTFTDIEFRIEAIKEKCPNLYNRMREMDAKNKIYRGLNIN